MRNVQDEINRLPKWYFGGCASALAACVTHPLDLLKVHLQTAKSRKEFNLLQRTVKIIEVQGYFALYNGLTASLFRQLTYSTTRFGLYEILKQSIDEDPRHLPFYKTVLIAGISGAAGGFLGTPGDVINVRMQNDIKLPNDLRRNYHSVVDGMLTVVRYEGTKALFNGTTMATSRAVLMTIGQLSMYDQFKRLILTYSPEGSMSDNTVTHLAASLMAGTTATTLTQPLDVIKTRYMNEVTGYYKGAWDVAKSIHRDYGPSGFFRGYVPAFVRLAPHTMLTFVFLEELRKNFGTPVYRRDYPTLDDIDTT